MPEPDMEWEYRERRRLSNGEYMQIPWVIEDWWQTEYFKAGSTINKHYSHISKTDKNLLAYTESEEKGQRDIQTQIRPGRYLTKFFPDLPQDVKEAACSDWKRIIDPDALKIATDPDTIQWVYENGPPSCMSRPASSYTATGGIHPTRAYGNSDLAIAYVNSSKGTPIARSVVYPEKMIYGSIYGEEALLEPLLWEAGYEQPDCKSFKGAKLTRIEGRRGYTICPYLDIADGVDDNGEHLIVGGYESFNVFGILGGEICARCEDELAEREVCVNHYGDTEMLCDGCYAEVGRECDGCGTSYYESDLQYITDGNGYRCNDCCEEIECDECGRIVVVTDSDDLLQECECHVCEDCGYDHDVEHKEDAEEKEVAYG